MAIEIGPDYHSLVLYVDTSKVGKSWEEEERKGKVWHTYTAKWRDQEEVQHWGEEYV